MLARLQVGGSNLWSSELLRSTCHCSVGLDNNSRRFQPCSFPRTSSNLHSTSNTPTAFPTTISPTLSPSLGPPTLGPLPTRAPTPESNNPASSPYALTPTISTSPTGSPFKSPSSVPTTAPNPEMRIYALAKQASSNLMVFGSSAGNLYGSLLIEQLLPLLPQIPEKLFRRFLHCTRSIYLYHIFWGPMQDWVRGLRRLDPKPAVATLVGTWLISNVVLGSLVIVDNSLSVKRKKMRGTWSIHNFDIDR